MTRVTGNLGDCLGDAPSEPDEVRELASICLDDRNIAMIDLSRVRDTAFAAQIRAEALRQLGRVR